MDGVPTEDMATRFGDNPLEWTVKKGQSRDLGRHPPRIDGDLDVACWRWLFWWDRL